MKLLNKYWPSIAHVALVLVTFLQPSVNSWADSHKAASGTVLVGWGLLLHWLTSPKNADVVANSKV